MKKIFIVVLALMFPALCFADSYEQLQHDLAKMGLDAGPRSEFDPQVVTVEVEPSTPSMPSTMLSPYGED